MKQTGTPQEVRAYTETHRRKQKWLTAVTGLAAVVVFCTVYLLILPAVTLESSGPYCGETAHQHISSCYDEDGTLVCDLSEHTHTLACYSDSSADVETASDWEETVSGVSLTENYALDLLQIAKTQLGYEESTRNYVVIDDDTSSNGYGAGTTEDSLEAETNDIEGETATEAASTEAEAETSTETAVTEDSTEATETVVTEGESESETKSETASEESAEESAETETTAEDENSVPEDDLSGVKKGYTRYGAWYGMPYEDWCAMFVSFCLNYAEVPTSAFPQDASCTSWINSLSGLGLYHSAASDYIAQPGDLVFFDFNGDGASDHVGIVAGYSNSSVSGSAAEKVLTATIKSLKTAVKKGEDAETETGAYLVTVEGNSDDSVQMVSYAVSSSDILGYGEMVENDSTDDSGIAVTALMQGGIMTIDADDASETSYTLLAGSSLTSYFTSATSVIFGYTSDYSSAVSGVTGTDVSADSSESIMLYTVGETVYVLSGGAIYANATSSGMFNGCTSLKNVTFGNFDTSNVTTMGSMFYNCSSLTSLDLSGFDTSNVTNIASMFYGCSSLESVNVSSFDTSKVTTMYQMFMECSSLTSLDLSSFDTSSLSSTSSVQTVSYMFYNCSKLTTIYASDWTGNGNVSSRTYVFTGCTSLVGDISYDSNKVTGAYCTPSGGYFTAKYILTLNYQDDAGTVTKTGYLANVETTLPSAEDSMTKTGYSEIVSWTAESDGSGTSYAVGDTLTITANTVLYAQWKRNHYDDGQSYTLTTGSDLTNYFTSATSVIFGFMSDYELELGDATGTDVSEKSDKSIMLYTVNDTVYVLSEGTICANADSAKMFENCTSLESITFDDFDTSNVTTMASMFYGCSSLTTLDVSGFDTSNVTTMASMFYGCSSLTTLDVSKFDTSKVTGMGSMFRGCSSLTTLDLSSFDTSNAKNTSYMFYGCSFLTTLDLSNFDTSGLSEDSGMSYMFYGCSSLTTLDLSSFDTSTVKNTSYMFYGCSSLTTLDLSSFDTSGVTTIASMFYGCSSLTTIKANDWTGNRYVKNSTNVFTGCTSLVGDISYNSSKTSGVYCTPSGGYFTGNLYLTLNYQNSDSDNIVEKKEVEKNSNTSSFEVTLPSADDAADDAPTGYTLSTWNTAADGSGTSYDAGATITMTASMTLYAQWKIAEYTLTTGSTLNAQLGNATQVIFGATNDYASVIEGQTGTAVDASGTGTIMLYNVDGVVYILSKGIIMANADSSGMFQNCTSLESVTFENFDTSSVTNMSSMFSGCTSLTSLDLTGFDMSSVTTVSSMFSGCTSLATIYADDWTDNSYVTSSTGVFTNCTSLVGGIKYDSSNTSGVYCATETGYFYTEYTLTLYYQNDANTTTSNKYAANSTVTLPEITKSGYVFKAWNTASDGTGTSYAKGATITMTEDLTLYAIWKESTATTQFTISRDGTTWLTADQAMTAYWGANNAYFMGVDYGETVYYKLEMTVPLDEIESTYSFLIDFPYQEAISNLSITLDGKDDTDNWTKSTGTSNMTYQTAAVYTRVIDEWEETSESEGKSVTISVTFQIRYVPDVDNGDNPDFSAVWHEFVRIGFSSTQVVTNFTNYATTDSTQTWYIGALPLFVQYKASEESDNSSETGFEDGTVKFVVYKIEDNTTYYLVLTEESGLEHSSISWTTDRSAATEITAANYTISGDNSYGQAGNYFGSIIYGLAFGGTYYVETTEYPDGYVVATGTKTITGGYSGSTYQSEADYNPLTVTYSTAPIVSILKTDATTSNALSGAQFVLYYTETGTDDSGNETTTTYYYKNGTWTALGDGESESDYALTSGTDGYVLSSVTLAKDTTYYLKEIAAPSGYTLLTSAVTFSVTSSGVTANGYTVTSSTDSDGDTVYTITVPNSTGYTLPHTGGAGTNLFTIGGLAMMAAAVGFGYRLRRRRERRSGI